jgi:hypothetical protein
MGEVSYIAHADVLPDSEPAAGKVAAKRMKEDGALGVSVTADVFEEGEAPFYLEVVYNRGQTYLDRVKHWSFKHDEYGTMVVTYMDDSTEEFKLGQATAVWKENEIEVKSSSE